MTQEVEQEVTPLTHLHEVKQIEASALDQLQDMYCELREELDPQLAAIKIKQTELAAVESQLLEGLDSNYPVDDSLVRKTEKWLLEASAKGKATEITDKQKLIEILGMKTYIELSSISITDLKKYLTAQQVKLVSQEVFKSKRRIKYAKK